MGFGQGRNQRSRYYEINKEEMKNLENLKRLLPLMGHRNWILVVDKAYPLQSSPGIDYLDTEEELLPVLDKVLGMLKSAPHVRPIVYMDQELEYMNDRLAPGADAFKEELYQMVKGFDVHQILHDQVFAKLDAASKLFNVAVVKTESLIPYTSVFIELDCGYWPAENEKILREAMKAAK